MIRSMAYFLLKLWLAIAICALFSISQIISVVADPFFGRIVDVYADDNDDDEVERVEDQVVARLIDSNYIVPHGMKMKKMKQFKRCKKKKKNGSKKKKKCNTQMQDFDLATFKITDPSMTVEQAIESLNQTGDYVYAEPDYMMRESAVPDDPFFSQQWALNSTHETDPDINAPVAWDITTGDSNVVIAIIDGGVDYTHPDLAANMWTNENEIPGDGIDNDLNGIVDDYYGYDAHNNDGDPMDDRGHGTHLAGIIGAVANNGIGIAGVNWNANMMAVKYLDQNGSGSISDAVDAINYVINMYDRGVNVKITNNSWGGRTFSQALSDAIGSLADKDILFFASAGNEVRDLEIFPYYPASYDQPNIMVVGMHGNVNQFIVDSNIGRSIVDISAPGENILSTALVTGASVCQDTDADGYSECTGSSMSTAYASGVAALVQSVYPDDTSSDIINRIIRSSKPSMVTTRFAIPWTGKSATGEIVDAVGALNYNGLTTWPGKFYIEVERPYELQQPIQISESIDISSLSDSLRSWNLIPGAEWITPSLVAGTALADQDTRISLDLQSEFQFGITNGSINFRDLSESNDFEVPITIRTRLQTLELVERTLDSPNTLDEMGFAVEIDGDIAVVSAPGEAVNAAFGGSVYVFRHQSDASWALESTLTGSDNISGDRFGTDVAISGNRIVVGAANNDSTANEAGAAYVFEYESSQWIEKQKLVPSGTDIDSDLFGTAVSIDGDLIAIGAPEVAITFRPGAAERKGSAYIFQYQSGLWQEQVKLLQSDATLNQYVRFGAAVDVQNSKVIVSSLYHPDDNPITSRTSGRVHSYADVDGEWILEQTIVPPETGVEFFGYRVVLNDDELIISAPQASNSLGIKVGSVFTFNLVEGQWTLGRRISPPDIEKDNVGFGISMDVDENRMVVGASSDGVKAINSGSAYAYKKVNNQWIPAGRLLPETAFSFSQLNYGRDVAISGNVAVIGSGLKTAANIPTTGYLYELSTPVPHLETITVNNVGSDWVSVSTQNEYQSMVAVCTVHYINNISPVVVRMQNIAIQSFEIKLQNPGDLDQVFADTVYCMIAEEGVWQLADGRKFEAKKTQSTSTARKGGWRYQVRQDYSQDYAAPIVFGQVMSFNDDSWSVFWNRGAKRTLPADSITLRTGKQVGEDTVTTRNDETIGYMVFDSGTSTIDSIELEIMLSADIVKHIGHSNNAIPVGIASFPEFAILTQSGMDGGDGSWPILEGLEALSFGQLRIAVDEDQIRDSERRHTTENVAYFTATSHLNTELIPIQ